MSWRGDGRWPPVEAVELDRMFVPFFGGDALAYLRSMWFNFAVLINALLYLMPAQASTGSGERPNIVFVMADDLDFDYKQDRLAIMPNLKKHWADAGV